MIDLRDYTFANAEDIYVVANTPMFIASKLKTDKEVIEISRRYSEGEIVETLRTILQKQPDDLRSRVVPLVLLVALALKQKHRAISVIAKEVHENYRWFDLLARSLVKGFAPITSVTFKPSRIISRTVTPPTHTTLKIGEPS